MLNSLPVRIIWHSLNWLSRIIVVASAVSAVLIAFSIMTLRYWLLPNIEQYHDSITYSLSAAIGSPVTIGKIQGEWRGFMPRLNLSDVQVMDDHRQTALVLKRIDGSLSWMSLLTAEIRLASLEIDSPELLIRRDAAGKLFIGNLVLSRKGENNDISDWLLHQSNLVVRNALIVWVDQQRDAPPLVLQQVNLRITNLFNRHRFALQALPPADLATPLDLRGEFYGTSFDNLSGWQGMLYTRFDYTDVTAWRPWLELPGEFSQGRGALRGWLGVHDGKVNQLTIDMDLRDVVTRLGADVPEMRVRELRGRAAWQELEDGVQISTKHLALRLQDGLDFQPTDFYFRTVKGGHAEYFGSQTSGGEIRANLLSLKNLTALAEYLPMRDDLRARLDAYAPRGKVINLDAQWQGEPGNPNNYRIKGHFENLGLNQVGKIPGFTGLTGDVIGSEASGRLSINAHAMVVDAPGVMREPLSFANLIGQGSWQRKDGELSVNVDNIAVSNDDLAGNLYGSYRTLAGTLGVLDLTGRLTRGNIRRAARYTPLIALNGQSSDWLNGALKAGHTEDFRIRIKGNLSDFQHGAIRCLQPSGEAGRNSAGSSPEPARVSGVAAISAPLQLQDAASAVAATPPPVFSAKDQTAGCATPAGAGSSKDMLFEIGGHAQDAVLEFDTHWPRIEHISGEFLIRGNRLVVESPSATILDTQLHNVTVTIPDIMSKEQSLEIKGEATGASSSFLEFVQKSPVRGYIDGFTDGISARGNGHLDLSARIPLSVDNPVKVSGTFKVQDNDINLGKEVPVLHRTRGALEFTEAGMHADNVSAEFLGGPATINVHSSEEGAVHANIRGRSNVDLLRKTEHYPVLDYLHGSTDWEADISMVKKSAQVVLTSRLQGLGSSFPAPFSKSAGESMLLRVERSPVMLKVKPVKHCVGDCPKAENIPDPERDVITARLGNLLSARLERRNQDGVMVVRRGVVSFGDSDKSPPSAIARKSLRVRTGRNDGVWLVGSLPELSLQGWGGLAGSAGKTAAAGGTGVAASSAEKSPVSTTRMAGDGSRPVIAGANLHIGKLSGYGQQVGAVHVIATRRGDGLAARLIGTGVKGEVVWEPHGYDAGNMFRARLSSLQLAGGEQFPPLPAEEPVKTPAKPVDSGQADRTIPGDIPALDISIENLLVKGKHIGHLELIGHPEDSNWRMRRLNITNPDGSLVGDGIWADAGGQQNTRLKLMLDISNAGQILARSGYPNTVKGGSGRLTADLSWAGPPDKFSYDTLDGSLNLNTGKGQFLKMDPGAGKLLSVLSLQDLPKHIALGFTDVFSGGFQFDNISGNATIKDGIINSQDFRIFGSSAKVTMKGDVNLNDETQNLQVRILPTLGDSVSLIGAFAISPAVGIGSLIVNKVLGNPLDKLASFEYNVTGSWRDPDVVRVSQVPGASKPGASKPGVSKPDASKPDVSKPGKPEN
ncbi:MAG: AsmA-like C-terminal region-containing protein [Gallionella sp.]